MEPATPEPYSEVESVASPSPADFVPGQLPGDLDREDFVPPMKDEESLYWAILCMEQRDSTFTNFPVYKKGKAGVIWQMGFKDASTLAKHLAMATIEKARDSGNWEVVAFHVHGPFTSPDDVPMIEEVEEDAPARATGKKHRRPTTTTKSSRRRIVPAYEAKDASMRKLRLIVSARVANRFTGEPHTSDVSVFAMGGGIAPPSQLASRFPGGKIPWDKLMEEMRKERISIRRTGDSSYKVTKADADVVIDMSQCVSSPMNVQ